MPQKNIQLYFFIALTICLFVLAFIVFKPYLGVIFVSVILSVAFYPLYEKFILWFKGKNLAAITTVIVIVIVVVATVFISAKISSEAVGLYDSMAFGGVAQKIIIYSDSVFSKLGQTFLNEPSFHVSFENYAGGVLSWTIGNFSSFFSDFFGGLLSLVLMLVSIYYLLCNGPHIKEKIVRWSPLSDHHDEKVLTTLRFSVDDVLRGRFLLAIAQGFFLGLGFLVFGLGNPVFWGFIGGMASLLPVLGISVIVALTSVYLFMSGSVAAGIGMLVWGALAIGFLDDTFSFFVLKRKIKINPLIILFSILGGVEFFGPLGLIAGPVLVGAFLSVLTIYPFIMSPKGEQF